MTGRMKTPSPALIISIIALIAALGGTAWAVSKNSVGNKQLKKNAVSASKIRSNAVTSAKIKAGAVKSAKIADGAVTGQKVAADSLTGDKIDESTLGQVPNAAQLDGKGTSAFVASQIYKAESAISAGTNLGDGTQYIDKACDPGDILLTGGPANIAATTDLLESFPTPGLTNSWRARVNKNAVADNFSVVVLCANQ